MVAAIAESVRFVEDNPEQAKAAVSKILKVKDPEALQSSYDAYATKLINRRLTVPINAVSDAVEIVRESGTKITRRPTDLVDNSYTDDLEKSGFLKELWGGKLP